jgi:adenine-specific DNA-methyltransferase
MIYGIRSNGNKHGLVLTKPEIVELMLDRVGYSCKRDLSHITLIEPASGDGAFAVEIIRRLYESSVRFNFSFQDSLSNLSFYELDNEIALALRERVVSLLKHYSANIPNTLIRIEDFLLSQASTADIIIGNPPYVRHENIPANLKDLYRKQFRTFRNRSDLYIAFYEKGLSLLKKDGTLSFICSNRWLKNQYGQDLRRFIDFNFSLREIIDLEGTCPFEEEVIAYPAITTISNELKQSQPTYLAIDNLAQLPEIDNLQEAKKLLDISNYQNWFAPSNSALSNHNVLTTIENQGFKIGIGVATGADKIFISKDLVSLVEEELVLPILTSKDLKNNNLNWSGNYVLNPYDNTGKLIDLKKYPRAAEYFTLHRETLEKRHVAQKSPNHWYKTIDRIYPALLTKDKILLPDISGNSHIMIDRGKHYPHHNLYYITAENYERLVILASILESDFIRKQLMQLGTTMNGGYPRWQSQNLKKLLIPEIDAMSAELRQSLTQAYFNRDRSTINELITPYEISRYEAPIGQTTLFEPSHAEYITHSD